MKIIAIYEAEDGKRFDDKRCCVDHEFDREVNRVAAIVGYSAQSIHPGAIRHILRNGEACEKFIALLKQYHEGLIIDKIVERAEHLSW